MKKEIPYRVSLENAISHPKDNSNKSDIAKITIYDINGKVHTSLKEEEIAAIKIERLDSKLYRIKAERSGKLFNPLKVTQTYGLNKRDRTTNEALFKYKNVSSKCFSNYVRFLKERHDSLLLIAERELI